MFQKTCVNLHTIPINPFSHPIMKYRFLRFLIIALMPMLAGAQTTETLPNDVPPMPQMPLPQLVEQRLDALVDDSLFEVSQLGLMVWDLTTDSVLYRRNHRQLMRTASTMKLLTAITALTYLGGSYQLTTSLYYKGTIAGHTLQGDLICVGGMDPMFDSDDMKAFAQSLKQKGVKTVKGRIVTDCSMKDTEKWGEGWCWDDDNPTLSPLLIKGKADFATQLLQELHRQGIATPGVRVAPGTLPSEGTQLLCRRSHQLREVLVQMMKESDNLYAESVFYQTAHWWMPGHVDKKAKRQPLTAVYGAQATTALLDTLGLPVSLYRIADGSGLSLYDYLSAECEVTILRYAWQHPDIYNDLLPSLPIAGEDGTLKNRMKEPSPAWQNVTAKTGSVSAVSALAGYCTAANGHRLCFAILNQGVRRMSDSRSFQDRVCEALCAF